MAPLVFPMSPRHSCTDFGASTPSQRKLSGPGIESLLQDGCLWRSNHGGARNRPWVSLEPLPLVIEGSGIDGTLGWARFPSLRPREKDSPPNSTHSRKSLRSICVRDEEHSCQKCQPSPFPRWMPLFSQTLGSGSGSPESVI